MAFHGQKDLVQIISVWAIGALLIAQAERFPGLLCEVSELLDLE